MTHPFFAHTIEERIQSLSSTEEVDGAIEQITSEGRMTPRIKNLLELHRAKVLEARKPK